MNQSQDNLTAVPADITEIGDECAVEAKLRKDSRNVILLSLVLIFVFITLCFFVYKVFIGSGRLLGVSLLNDGRKLQNDIKIASQGEALSYSADVDCIISRAQKNDNQVIIDLSVNCSNDNLYVFSPRQFVLRCSNPKENVEKYIAPNEENKFAFVEQHLRKFVLTYDTEDGDWDYSLVLYNDNSDIVGKIAVTPENDEFA